MVSMKQNTQYLGLFSQKKWPSLMKSSTNFDYIVFAIDVSPQLYSVYSLVRIKTMQVTALCISIINVLLFCVGITPFNRLGKSDS